MTDTKFATLRLRIINKFTEEILKLSKSEVEVLDKNVELICKSVFRQFSS